MSTTEDRIENLQSQVRRQRRWNIALGVVVVVGGLMAATGVRSVPDVIQAKSFEVVNDEGKAVVLLESVLFKGEHYGQVATQNGKGQALVRLGANADGCGLVGTQNGKGQELVKLAVTTDGQGVIETKNGKGLVLVHIGVTADGGSIATTNGKDRILVQLGANTDGNGSVVTQNGKGGTLVVLSANTDGNGGLVKTEDGKGRITSQSP
ncbi:hypothetical protein N8596_00905 [bacterium]|nr:hypothetical protein [bacterium]